MSLIEVKDVESVKSDEDGVLDIDVVKAKLREVAEKEEVTVFEAAAASLTLSIVRNALGGLHPDKLTKATECVLRALAQMVLEDFVAEQEAKQKLEG